MIFDLIIESKEICGEREQMEGWSCGNHETIQALWEQEKVELVSVIGLVDFGQRCGCELKINHENKTLTVCDDARPENI